MNPANYKNFLETYEEKQERFILILEKTIKTVVLSQTKSSALMEVMEYSVFGGKHFRALLLLSVGELLSLKKEEILPLCIAIELVHAYSLAHDDLPCMDNSPTRRGKLSCWKQFNEAAALLSGNALLLLAFQIIAKAGYSPGVGLNLVTELAIVSGPSGMIAGQMHDVFQTYNPTIEDVLNVQALKTGALFSFCFTSPCFIKGGEFLDDLKPIGYTLGQIYQIIDDWLDEREDVKEKYLSQGEKKITTPDVLSLEESRRFVKKQLFALKSTINKLFPLTDGFFQFLLDKNLVSKL